MNIFEPDRDWKRYLSKREVEVCTLICRSPKPLGFNEIKRRTGFHQEILSRILKRLIFLENIRHADMLYSKWCECGQ